MARKPAKAQSLPLLTLLGSWVLALAAANRQPGTIREYEHTVRLFARYSNQHGLPAPVDEVEADHIRAFLIAVRRGCWTDDAETEPCACGLVPSSAGNADKHFRNLKACFNWLIKEGHRSGDHPMRTVARPTVPDEPEDVFTDAELAALLKECSGPSFMDRRDTAIMRIFMDTGMRVDSMARLRYSADPQFSDVDLKNRLLRIRTKGGDTIVVPIGKKAARDLDRYILKRARHEHADEPWLWLGERGRLQTSGVQQMLKRRGVRAQVTNVHAHRFRHTFADDWLEAGGSAQDLMQIAGWKSMAMVARYGRSEAARRAQLAHARISPGDRI